MITRHQETLHQRDFDVAKHFKKCELEKHYFLDFHFKRVKNRFKKLSLS